MYYYLEAAATDAAAASSKVNAITTPVSYTHPTLPTTFVV